MLQQQCVVALELVGQDVEKGLAARAVHDVSGVHVDVRVDAVDEVENERGQRQRCLLRAQKSVFKELLKRKKSLTGRAQNNPISN